MTEHRPYTDDERCQIEELYFNQGLSVAKIGSIIGRPHGSVNNQVTKIAAQKGLHKRGWVDGKPAKLATASGSTTVALSHHAKVHDTQYSFEVVTKLVEINTFWRTRLIPITLPRLRCLERPPL